MTSHCEKAAQGEWTSHSCFGTLVNKIKGQDAMARGKKKASHNHVPPPPLHKFCTYCQVHQVVWAFAKHQRAYKRIWQMDHEACGVNRTVGNNKGHCDRNETLDEMVNIFELVIPQHLCIDSCYLDCWRTLIRKWKSIDGYWWRYVDLTFWTLVIIE